MATKLVDKGNSVYEISTSINGETWKSAQEKALKKLAEKVQIDGFRKGKAPLNLIKDRINPMDLINEAINVALPAAYNEVIAEHKLNPYTHPEVNVTSVKDDGFEVTFTVTTYPEVELGQYKGINVPLEVEDVTAKEVKAAIDNLLEENSELTLKEAAAEKGDTVVFDFKGYIDGKEFEGGSADNYSLVLGSNQFIPGFEDQLVGVSAGDKKDVLVTFPEQYVKDLAGKDAKFVCMVHEIKTKKVPELNDEFVAGLGLEGVATVADLKKQQKARILEQKKQQAQQKQFSTILKTICDNAKVSIADKVIEDEAARMKENMIQQITQNGLTFEQYKEITGMTDETILKQFKEESKARLIEFFVFNKVGQVENLVLTRQEIDSYYEQIAKTYNMNVEDVKKTFANNEDRIAQNLFQGKIEKFIMANNGDLEPKAETAEKEPAKKPAAKKTTTKKTTTKKTTKKTEEVKEDK